MTDSAFYMLFFTLEGGTALVISWFRIWVIFKVVPMFSGELLPAMARNMITVALCFALLPGVMRAMPDNIDQDFFWFVSIIAKETLIGLVIGHTISMAFWTVGSIGFFIDNQRGASMASTMNPMLGDQTSPLGTFFTQTLTTILFVSGGMLLVIKGIYSTFVLWPPLSYYPDMSIDKAIFFLSQFDEMMMYIVLLGGPLVGCMFLAEFGLGLVGRFAPQLNVFFLAMPIKSGVAFVLLLFYLPVIMVIMHDEMLATEFITKILSPVFQ